VTSIPLFFAALQSLRTLSKCLLEETKIPRELDIRVTPEYQYMGKCLPREVIRTSVKSQGLHDVQPVKRTIDAVFKLTLPNRSRKLTERISKSGWETDRKRSSKG